MIIGNLTVHGFLENSAFKYPEKTAVIHDGVEYTYARINTLVNNLAKTLSGCGLVHGDRVVIVLNNGIEYIVSYYAAMKCGGVAVPLSNDIKSSGLKLILSELKAAALITSSYFDEVVAGADIAGAGLKAVIVKNPEKAAALDSAQSVSWDDAVTGDNSNPDLEIPRDSLASIIYTSGSTGVPKGVMLTHANIAANTESICSYLGLTENDRQMAVLPFFYVMGKSLLNTHFAAGGSIVLNNRFAYTGSVLKQMVDYNVTGFSGVPSTYAYLLHRSPLATYRDKLVSLRYCSQAGGHMPRQIKEELRRVLPDHTDIYIMYGATEASARLTYLPPQKFNEKIESIGIAIPGVSMKVVDNEGNLLASGETGELVGSGPNIMQGYWMDEELSGKVLDSHGYHTGDLGYMDEDGFFYLVGRKDSMLKCGGHRINPQEVEDALIATGLLVETAVIGVPDDLLGNRLVAFAVAINNETSENDILAVCSGLLPKYKVPSEVRLMKSLPKKASGKIDKAQCVANYNSDNL